MEKLGRTEENILFAINQNPYPLDERGIRSYLKGRKSRIYNELNKLVKRKYLYKRKKGSYRDLTSYHLTQKGESYILRSANISIKEIKEKYPLFYESLETLKHDVGFPKMENKRIKIDEKDLASAERFLSKINDKTLNEVFDMYNFSEYERDFPYQEYAHERDMAIREFTIGDDMFQHVITNKDEDAKKTYKLLGEFFDGKYTHIFR